MDTSPLHESTKCRPASETARILADWMEWLRPFYSAANPTKDHSTAPFHFFIETIKTYLLVSFSMGTRTETIKFNIGGTRYEVSRSLLEQHPDTMMARMASKDWQAGDNIKGDSSSSAKSTKEKEEEDLFIERDGERFKYVLDYMRDGKVHLPAFGIPKDAFLSDLEYYGFTSVDDATIILQIPEKEIAKHSVSMLERGWELVIEQARHAEEEVMELICMLLATACFQEFMEEKFKNPGTFTAATVNVGQIEQKAKMHLSSGLPNHTGISHYRAFSLTDAIHFNDGKIFEQYLSNFGLRCTLVSSSSELIIQKL